MSILMRINFPLLNRWPHRAALHRIRLNPLGICCQGHHLQPRPHRTRRIRLQPPGRRHAVAPRRQSISQPARNRHLLRDLPRVLRLPHRWALACSLATCTPRILHSSAASL
jgi:hypothetical protein